jgi:ribosomal protein S18 acetylase RimI-like enzyme
MEIIRLDQSQKQKAAMLYARVFFDYPQFVTYHPSLEWRKRHFTTYCEFGLKTAFRYGEVYADPDLRGVICWFPPENTFISTMKYLKVPGFIPLVRLVGLKNFSRIITCEDYSGKVQRDIIPGPHWYLWGFAVDQDFRMRGIGSSLMEPGIARADQQGLPIYLETHDENKVPYYQKRGFELIRSERVPKIELPFWCLLRQPA